jgi:putative ABC transport system substrate-binding protein
MRVRSDAEIVAGIASLGREQAGLPLQSDSFLVVHRGTIISLAARNKVPVIGADLPSFAKEGGLLQYGENIPDIFRRAVSYVDSHLAWSEPERPSGAGAPTKYELIINLNIAKALGLDIPPNLLALADEVIE